MTHDIEIQFKTQIWIKKIEKRFLIVLEEDKTKFDLLKIHKIRANESVEVPFWIHILSKLMAITSQIQISFDIHQCRRSRIL